MQTYIGLKIVKAEPHTIPAKAEGEVVPHDPLVHLLNDDGTEGWCGTAIDESNLIARQVERTTCPACKEKANKQFEAEGLSVRI